MDKMKKLQLQQGDVLLKQVQNIPDGLKPIKDPRGVVLAEGETTGHFHGITDAGATLLEDPTTKKRYLNIEGKKEVSLNHQEHNTITIPPGKYEVGIVREMDHVNGLVRKVVD